MAFIDYANNLSSWTTLNKLLDVVLQVTGSEYGFIGRKTFTKVEKVLALGVEAVTNIAWHPDLEKVDSRKKIITDFITLFSQVGGSRRFTVHL